ncbi:MAG: hypothetical protein [Siphoviridae sp. cttb18]|nr:MAG: hypothetical protein [Siphoviridae sp. cttb18]
MTKTLMRENRRYKIREIEISSNNWLTFAYKVKSMSILKVALILAGVAAFILFNYWLNEMLFIRDMQLFSQV